MPIVFNPTIYYCYYYCLYFIIVATILLLSPLSVFWIPGYPGLPAPGPLQRPSFGPGVKRRPKPNGEDPHEEAPHEENDG
jgi:hypothetical protein